MITMRFLLFFSIIATILPGSLSVHPGDPFPTDQSKLKPIPPKDLLDTNEILDPDDDQTPSPSKSLTDPIIPSSDEENSIVYPPSSSTKSILAARPHHQNLGRKINLNKQQPSSTTKSTSKPYEGKDNLDKKPPGLEKSSILSSTTSINKKNLIKIGRWKHNDPLTKSIRYWYEPEGGHMGTGWAFDGFIFQAYNKSELDTEPVYAFHSEIRSIWTNTVQMDPKSPVIGNDQWIPDGVSFYAYKTSLNSTELQPVLRYWNKLKAGATDATETRITYLLMENEDNNNEDRTEWTFDNILFYALPIKDQI